MYYRNNACGIFIIIYKHDYKSVFAGGSAFFSDLCEALKKFHVYEGNLVYLFIWSLLTDHHYLLKLLCFNKLIRVTLFYITHYHLFFSIPFNKKKLGKRHVPHVFDFIRVKSYSGTNSTGEVAITGCDLTKLKGQHVIFVEDIIDTGLTMTKVFNFMSKQVQPASVNVCALCEKRTPLSCGFKAKYSGFSVPDKFIVGYGMDYNEIYRDLGHVAVINQAGIEKFKEI